MKRTTVDMDKQYRRIQRRDEARMSFQEKCNRAIELWRMQVTALYIATLLGWRKPAA